MDADLDRRLEIADREIRHLLLTLASDCRMGALEDLMPGSPGADATTRRIAFELDEIGREMTTRITDMRRRARTGRARG